MAYVSFPPKLFRLRRQRRHDVNSWAYRHIVLYTVHCGGSAGWWTEGGGAGRTTPGLKVCPRFKNNIFIADITP